MNDRAADDPLDTSLLFDVFALSEAVGRMLSDAMSDGPLTPSQYALYSAIFELEAASPTQLAARLGMRLTTFMDRLRIVERRGHAQRVDHPDDRRSYRVTLTAAGRSVHQVANGQFELAHTAFVAALGRDHAASKRALRSLHAAADTARRAVQGPCAVVDVEGLEPTASRV